MTHYYLISCGTASNKREYFPCLLVRETIFNHDSIGINPCGSLTWVGRHDDNIHDG